MISAFMVEADQNERAKGEIETESTFIYSISKREKEDQIYTCFMHILIIALISIDMTF